MEIGQNRNASPSLSSSADGPHMHDSDFDSSDLDPVLMSIGQSQDCESAKTAKVWAQRRAANRKRSRANKRTAAAAVACADDRSSCDSSEGGSSRKRRRGSASSARSSAGSVRSSALERERAPAVVSEEVRSVLVRGQQQYSAGLLDQAMESMHQVMKMQPGLADPYQLLAVIWQEKGNARKKLECMLLSAYFTSGDEGRLIWRQVAILSKQQGLVDQARYAYRRSFNRKNLMADDLECMWELAQLYFQKGRVDEGIRELYALYEATKDETIACQVAKHLISRKRWRECLELLEACVERGRQATPVRVDLNILNMYCDLLLEVREFTKCANLLTDILQLRGSGEVMRGNMECQTSLSDVELIAKLRQLPADLVAQLAVALSRLRQRDAQEADPLCAAAIKAVLLQPPATHSDLYLLVVDGLLADESATVGQVLPRGQRRSNTCRWAAEEALRILGLLEDAEINEDLRERRAKALWQLGQVKEAAVLLDEVLDFPAGRSEAELRELAARSAEAWFECGHPERADAHLGFLNYEDLQHSSMLPQALSTEQRRSHYQELNMFIDRVTTAQASSSSSTSRPPLVKRGELQKFTERFRQLIYDCELDYTRLSRFEHSTLAAREPPMPTESKSEMAGTAESAAANSTGLQEPPLANAFQSAASSISALAVLPQSGEADDEDSRTLVPHALAKRRGNDLQVAGKDSAIIKHKRRHIGLESIEDLFGFEAYIEFVVRGINLLLAHAPKDESGVGLRVRILELSRLVEISEMILQNRRLATIRNPVKRRMLRTLILKSAGLAFEARLWRVVFKHLRSLCGSGQHDVPLALFTRVLFTHADVQLLPRHKTNEAVDRAPWEKHTAFSPWGHRNTYAASFTDARSWALRQLLRNPRSFVLISLSGHFCVVASQYKLAIAEYCRAHRLAPFDALTCLCLGASYISFAMSRTAAHRHDLILKGFTFIQRYRKLRLQVIGKWNAGIIRKDHENGLPKAHKQRRLHKKTKETIFMQEPILDLIAHHAEAYYNYGRGFHQLSIYNLAMKAYRDALAIFTALERSDSASLKSLCGEEVSSLPESESWRRRTDLCAIRRSCAYNLALLFRGQGSTEMAQKTLWDHIVF